MTKDLMLYPSHETMFITYVKSDTNLLHNAFYLSTLWDVSAKAIGHFQGGLKFINMCGLCCNLYGTNCYIWVQLLLLLWTLNVTIPKINIVVKKQLKYSTKLF